MRLLTRIAPLVLLVSLLGASATAPGDTARYDFDGTTPLRDLTGHGHDLSPVSWDGGAADPVGHDGGSALAFPEPCHHHHRHCPEVVLQATSAGDLNPGTRPIRWGASVLLAANRTTKGENVVQKGYSTRTGQYKLQVDGVEGRPSCVMTDDVRRKPIHVALSDVSVADGRWHRLECRRRGTVLNTLIDGVQHGRADVPADLSVTTSVPLSVGGKGSQGNNDQFQGRLDDVWVSISR